MALIKIRQPRVYIPTKTYHNFNDAKRFGELVFCTDRIVNREDVQYITRSVVAAMEGAEAGDYIMISGLSVINSIMCGIFVGRFGKINFLMFNDDTQRYISKRVILTDVIDKGSTNDKVRSR